MIDGGDGHLHVSWREPERQPGDGRGYEAELTLASRELGTCIDGWPCNANLDRRPPFRRRCKNNRARALCR
jgi:hypothetical protein